MSPRTPSQNQEIRAKTRQEIKDAAFELFAQHGFSDTNVRAIAQKAGKSKGLIYHYFNSKEEILKAIFDDLTSLGDQAMNFPEELSSSERLEYLLQNIFGYIKESTDFIRLMISLALKQDAMDKLKPLIDQYNAHQLEIMSDIFEELGYANPKTQAYYLGAKLDGITMGYITLGDDYPFKEMRRKIMEEYVPNG